MQINLKELAAGSEPIHLTDTFDLSSEIRSNNEQDVIAFSPVTVDLHAHYSAGVAEVTGDIKIQLTQSCSRCLKPIDKTLTIPVRELFTALPEAIRDNEDEMFHLVTTDKVDLRPYLEEIVLVELPLAPLCDIDCQGICPNCGVNRNEEQCNCSTDTIDPRLAGLADFFKK
jgi:uncharacterized protein